MGLLKRYVNPLIKRPIMAGFPRRQQRSSKIADHLLIADCALASGKAHFLRQPPRACLSRHFYKFLITAKLFFPSENVSLRSSIHQAVRGRNPSEGSQWGGGEAVLPFWEWQNGQPRLSW